MKIAAAAFLGLLLYAHWLSPAEAFDQPLSLFREGPTSALGYALFAVLGLIGVAYVAELVRFGLTGEAVASAFILPVLTVVAYTPSWDEIHSLFAAAALLLLFVYYALLLHRVGSAWKLIHLAIPLLLLAATRFHSYGIWQKCIITYFVLAAMVHHHVLRRRYLQRGASQAELLPDGLGNWMGKRKLYRVEPGAAWKRRAP